MSCRLSAQRSFIGENLAAKKGRILAAAASGIGDFIARHGVDPCQVFSETGVPEAAFGNPCASLDLDSYVKLIEVAARRTGNDTFGLHFGQTIMPRNLGLIGGIVMASPCLGAALTNLVELFPYHQHATHVALSRHCGYARLEYRIVDGRIVERRQDAELALGMFVNVFRHCLGSRWTPEQVYCEHVRPQSWREHERVFGGTVQFGQQTNAIVFRQQDMVRRMPGCDPAKLSDLRNELVAIAGQAGSISFLDVLKAEIRSRLPGKPLCVAEIAAAMGLTRWTFQRRLAEYDINFSKLVDAVRRDLANIYLRQPHVSITDIALILGYSELSALSRAFRRWYGMAPQKIAWMPRSGSECNLI